MYLADSAASILAGNYHTLKPGEAIDISLDDSAADEDLVFMDLSELFFDGQNTNDKLVVSYLVEESCEY